MVTIKVSARRDIPENYTGIVEYSDGSKHWLKSGQWHREDGPAVEEMEGTKEWWIEGKLHREDGPAIIHPDGAKEWWVGGYQTAAFDHVTQKVNYFLTKNNL